MEELKLILESQKTIMLALHQGLVDTLDEQAEESLIDCCLRIEDLLNPIQEQLIKEQTKDGLCVSDDGGQN